VGNPLIIKSYAKFWFSNWIYFHIMEENFHNSPVALK